jgi:hypothetical protein
MNIGDIIGSLFSFGRDVMSATIDSVTGIVSAQFGDAVAGVAESSNCEVWQQWGYASLPSPPSAGQNGAQAIAIKRGVLDIIFGGRDARAGQIYGNLKAGEVCVFATGVDGNGQGRVLLKQDGSVTLFTTDSNTKSGNAVFFRVSPTDGLTFSSPWGSMRLGPNGFHLDASGVALDMNNIGGMPGVPSAISGRFSVKAGSVKLDAPSVKLGPSLNPLGYQPLAYGFAANPLTMPGVPITAFPFSPTGLFTSNSVFVSAP